eukprot:scaffold3956_cov99-Cylindrotheca_fusiformis.AAC.8
MGKNNRRKNQKKKKVHSKKYESNFVTEAGPGCYIARRDMSPDWLIEWEDVDPREFEGEEVPEVAVDTEEQTLSLCNIKNSAQVAYVTVYETRVLDARGREMKQGTTTNNRGETHNCITFIVLCPPCIFAHLCFLDIQDDFDISKLRIESDIQEWNQHPHPSDEHPQTVGFPLQGGPFLCTQGENGALTHFFSGNLHAIDFRCPIGTKLLAVGDGTVIEAKDSNTLTGIAVSNLFEWNSILIKLDTSPSNRNENVEAKDELFVEYVHIQHSTVKAGDRVLRGQSIGTSGSVGFSPEPHLHFSAFRTSEPVAPTVRVKFQAKNRNAVFLPKAGTWYDDSGALQT